MSYFFVFILKISLQVVNTYVFDFGPLNNETYDHYIDLYLVSLFTLLTYHCFIQTNNLKLI